MNIIVANKDDYIKFNARIINKIHYFELTNDTKDYIIHRVSLGNNSHDVSLMDSCINNLLDEQYEKGKYITLDEIKEINDLILKLNKEECNILNAYAEINSYTIKDFDELKNLIKNIDNYQILKAYSLHEVGLLIVKKLDEYKVNINMIPYVDYVKLAEQYLFDANIKERFCSYGLFIDTSEMSDNELIQPKIEKDKVLKVEVVNKKEFEESSNYSKIIVYLPSTDKVLKEKFKRINLDFDRLTIQDTHITKCEIVNFEDYILAERFNKVMEYELDKFSNNSYTTPFQEIELLCKEIKKFDNIKMQKFLALEEIKDKNINYIHDLVECAKQISNYELLPNVNDLNDMGKYLVNETGHFDDISFLKDYIDYYKLAKDYTREGCTYNGDFTEYGYIMKKEFEENIENKKESEEEEYE